MNDFWKNKNVLMTGHTGFVGTWLCMVLEYFGAKVVGLSLRAEEGSLYACVKNQLSVQNIYQDIRDADCVKESIRRVKPDIIFHLAAFGFVQECLENPTRAYSTNVMGSLNLFEAIRDISGIKAVVVASSDKVYQNLDKNICYFKESDILGGSDPYSCSKTQEDLLAQSYYSTYLSENSVGMAILRPSNILGGGDHNFTRLIPYLLDCIERKVSPVIRNPQAVRPWQHILDMADAYLCAAEYASAMNRLDIFNVGPKKESIVSVGEIADILLVLSGQESKYSKLVKEQSHTIEHKFLGLSIDKICDVMHWSPRKTITDTLKDVYRFKKEEQKIGAYNACMNQVYEYWG